MDVERRTLLPHDERLNRSESAVALVACDLEGEESTHGILDRQSFARRQNQLSHGVYDNPAGQQNRHDPIERDRLQTDRVPAGLHVQGTFDPLGKARRLRRLLDESQ